MNPALWIEKVKHALRNHECPVCYQTLSGSQVFCRECLAPLEVREANPIQDPEQAHLYAATLFSNRLKQLIYGYKFSRQRQQLPILSQLLVHYARQLPPFQEGDEPIWVTFIPGRSSKKSSVNALALRFSVSQNYTYLPNLLGWQRETQPQHQVLSRSKRFQNIQNSLKVSSPLKPKTVAPKIIVVVDDFITTGATLMEATRALQVGGYEHSQIIGLGLCHIPLRASTPINCDVKLVGVSV